MSIRVIAVVVGAAVAAAAGIVSHSAGVSPIAIIQTQMVGLAYLVAGTVAWHRHPGNRIGPLLTVISYTWYVSDFLAAPVPGVAALAFATRNLVDLLTAFLLLLYPSGRFELRRHRALAGFLLAVTTVQVLARLLLNDRVPAAVVRATRPSTLGCDCANPFQLVSAPDLYAAIGYWTALLFVAGALMVLLLVILRLTEATVPMRRMLWPVLLGALVGMPVFAAGVFSYVFAMAPDLVVALGWVISLARTAVPIGFLVGILRLKIDRAGVATLVVGLHDERLRNSLERSIADALHDPQVKLGYWSPAARGYLDAAGKILAMPQPGSGLSATLVQRADEPLGAIIHDAALDDDKALLDAVAAAFALTVERDRLASTVHAQTSEARRLPDGQVTFLYADIEDSTLLLERLGQRYADVLAEERRILRAVVRGHGGLEVDSRADEFFAAFAQAADPVGAALEIQRRLRDHAWPDGTRVRVRIGLHVGQPQLTDEGYVGLDVHRASRVGSAGHGEQILLSEAARGVFEAGLPAGATLDRLGTFQLKGLPDTEPISQLTVPDLRRDHPPLRIGAPAEEGSKADRQRARRFTQ
jgi:class 3 adenylate cyclase